MYPLNILFGVPSENYLPSSLRGIQKRYIVLGKKKEKKRKTCLRVLTGKELLLHVDKCFIGSQYMVYTAKKSRTLISFIKSDG